MPTKTRLDPKADGDGPSAEPSGAPGAGPGDKLSSVSAGPPAGVAGFIDALNSMSAHVKAREAMEAEARRRWTTSAALCAALLAAQAIVDLFLLNLVRAMGNAGLSSHTLVPLALAAVAGVTAALALVLFVGAAGRQLRLVADSADRVALRHEDSPVRDRIRISQWILIDTVFTRFCVADRAAHTRRASLLAGISLWATAASWAALAAGFALPVVYWASDSFGFWNATTLGVFAVLALATAALNDKRLQEDRGLAQHYARQVLSFDRDFGGFLPRAERERVEAAAARPPGRGGAVAAE